ncbi:hypothetical protein A4G18_05810 [Pasteurellaceae bacterium Pebbles2]|nr:hypothetical protein [Pasteurellaceae bacterium Pebbles2]
MKKRIILGITTTHGISDLIIKNLQFYGFEVFNITSANEKFNYPSILSRLIIKFRKVVLKDKNAKLRLRSEFKKQEIENKIKNEIFDFGLFFLAQNYSKEFISYVKTKVSVGGMINYQWDGVKRYPAIFDRVQLFDKVYVFNPTDLDIPNNNFLPATSFYFDYDKELPSLEYDFYFLGAHSKDRVKDVLYFSEYAKKYDWKLNFQIYCEKSINSLRNIYPDNITLLEKNDTKSYEQNLEQSKKSKVLVDFLINEHTGLSLRTFEALGYDKKLITTNKDISKYDFYHPDNIFILDNNIDDLKEFLEKPYFQIDPQIKEKYSFGNWIKYILNIEPHQKIDLPRIAP